MPVQAPECPVSPTIATEGRRVRENTQIDPISQVKELGSARVNTTQPDRTPGVQETIWRAPLCHKRSTLPMPSSGTAQTLRSDTIDRQFMPIKQPGLTPTVLRWPVPATVLNVRQGAPAAVTRSTAGAVADVASMPATPPCQFAAQGLFTGSRPRCMARRRLRLPYAEFTVTTSTALPLVALAGPFCGGRGRAPADGAPPARRWRTSATARVRAGVQPLVRPWPMAIQPRACAGAQERPGRTAPPHSRSRGRRTLSRSRRPVRCPPSSLTKPPTAVDNHGVAVTPPPLGVAAALSLPGVLAKNPSPLDAAPPTSPPFPPCGRR